jgi:arylsulfatase
VIRSSADGKIEDTGPHMNTWPDAAMTRFRGEKNTNWEGGWRVPSMVRWPGKIEAGSVSNEIMHHMDWLPTFLAAAGEPQIKEKLLKGYSAIGRKYKVHLDGYDFRPFLTGKVKEGPRHEIFYFSDDGDLTALRYNDWLIDRAYLPVPAQDYVGQFLSTFKELPPRQKAASFSLDQVMEQLSDPGGTHWRLI